MTHFILPIRAGTSMVYFIENGNQSILVDAGNKRQTNKIRKAIKKAGYDITSVAAIILTHAHYDHVGCLAKLKELTGAKVYVHKNDYPAYPAGYSGLPDGTTKLFRMIVAFGRKFLKNLGAFEPVEPDVEIQNTYPLKELQINAYMLPTPGHTRGSVSLVLEDTHAFIGDSAFNVFPGTIFPPFANYTDELIRSWKILLDTGAKTFWPGHGNQFSREKLLKDYKRHIQGNF